MKRLALWTLMELSLLTLWVHTFLLRQILRLQQQGIREGWR